LLITRKVWIQTIMIEYIKYRTIKDYSTTVPIGQLRYLFIEYLIKTKKWCSAWQKQFIWFPTFHHKRLKSRPLESNSWPFKLAKAKIPSGWAWQPCSRTYNRRIRWQNLSESSCQLLVWISNYIYFSTWVPSIYQKNLA
jgi:hypothetical protein